MYEKKLAKQAEEQERQNAQYQTMMQDRRKLKSLWAAQKAGTENKGKKMRGKKKNKKDFSSPISESETNRTLSMNQHEAFPENSSDLSAADKRTSNTKGELPHKMKKSRSFRAHKTKEGKVYFSDVDTGKSVWKLPEDAVLL